MFGRLKNLFGSSPREPAERTIYFHEDDYCQIELLPISAREHCSTQMGIIDEFAAKHSDGGLGYTDIYLRPDAPHSFAELRVSISTLSAALQAHLPGYDSVFTGYSSHREQCRSTSAWGGDSFTIFADYQDDIVQHVWLDFGVGDTFDSTCIASALRAIPSSERILIADWSWSLIAAISDSTALDDYFAQRTRIS